jgi:hypothetical protein
MAVPVGWGVSISLDTPVLFYAASSEKFVQANIPLGGAVMVVTAHDTTSGNQRTATTPEAWARAETRALASTVPPIEPFEFPKESGVVLGVICSYVEPTFSPDQRAQRSVAIYWAFDQKLFSAHLNYNSNEPNGPTFEKVLLQTIRSIRPLKGE